MWTVTKLRSGNTWRRQRSEAPRLAKRGSHWIRRTARQFRALTAFWTRRHRKVRILHSTRYNTTHTAPLWPSFPRHDRTLCRVFANARVFGTARAVGERKA